MHNTRHEVRWKLHIQDSQSMLHYPSIKISIYYMAANATEQVTYVPSYLTNMPSYGTVQAQNRTYSQVSFAHAVIIAN